MDGIFSMRGAAIALSIVASTIVVSGCDSDAASNSAPRASAAKSLPQDWYRGERPIVRSQVDPIRSRIWVLTMDGVALYEASTGEEIAQIPLPGWVWVSEQYACPPGLAIGPDGEAVVSSNAVPSVWRIDPATLVASEHVLVVDDDTGKDIGFTGLAYSARQGAYIAVSAGQGSLWRIDPRLRRAQGILLSAPLANACDVAIRSGASDQRASRFVGFCVRAGRENWLVNLAPDQRSGYVSRGACVSASLTP